MRCPKCRVEKQIEQVKTGHSKMDYILACWSCPWQVAAQSLANWMRKWNK